MSTIIATTVDRFAAWADRDPAHAAQRLRQICTFVAGLFTVASGVASGSLLFAALTTIVMVSVVFMAVAVGVIEPDLS